MRLRRINYKVSDDCSRIAIDCNDTDVYGWGGRLCESVLDGAPWAKVVDRGEYLIEDANQMETLVDFLRAFNAAEMDNEDLNNAISDWSILI